MKILNLPLGHSEVMRDQPLVPLFCLTVMSTVIVIVLRIFQDDTVNDVVETENALIDHALTMSETPLTQQPM